MSVGNRPGMIKTDNLGMNVGTSRGYMDNKSAGVNTEILDVIAGAMQETRFLPTINIAGFTDDVWTYVALPPAVATMIAEAAFGNGQVRFTNAVKILCARFRALCNTPGAGGVISLMLRKGGSGASAADNLLLNPVLMDDSVATVQNQVGLGKGQPSTPIIGNDEDGISLWIMVDSTVSETDMDLEVIIGAQMVPGTPPDIVET